MSKSLIVLILIVSFNSLHAQIRSNKIEIKGEVTNKLIADDSIYFNNGVIDSKYYEIAPIYSKLDSNKFLIKTNLSYPHMFRIVFASDKNIRVWRLGEFFIDASTNFITINYTEDECNELSGQTALEYSSRFVPFFTQNKTYNCKSNDFYQLVTDKGAKYDSLLFNYVVKYPHSYVALWSLIERFSLLGQSELRQQILKYFSSDIKNSKPWGILNNDLKNAKIKEREKFPAFAVKTTELKEQKLALPKAKFILIDYWFSRCRPCLDTLPSLKKLYTAYHSKGFEIISISTDKTKDVSVWKKRIKEYEIPWPQYLDENGIEAKRLSVHDFPSTFLLNEKGEMIKKHGSYEELEKFLSDHLPN